MRKNKEIKNEISKVVQGMMNEDAKEVKIAQTIGQNGAVNIGTPENDLVYYTNVVDPDDPNPNNPTMIIKAVTISISAAQRYSQACLNQVINMYPAFNDYLGDHNGKKSLNVYVVLDERITTMATDRRNIYINPLFLWKLAHKNNFGWAAWSEEYEELEPKDRRGLWPICDQGNVFVIMHEVYHCLNMHHLREEKFRKAHPEITDFDHDRANVVQDQEINAALEAYCYFDGIPDLNGKQSGVVKNIQGILFDKDGEGWNKVSSEMYDKLYQGPFEIDECAGVYEGESMEEIWGYKVKRKYPTNFGQTWEDMYLYFQEHGWPEKSSRKNSPQMGNGGQNSSSNNKNDNPEDQEIYDAGYYDGYYGKPVDGGLKNESDYQMGYTDGQENRAIDDQNNTCINSPEYIQGREDAENGLVNESKIYLDRNHKNSSVLMKTYQQMKQCGYLCEWVNIDKDSDYYKQGVASVLSKRRQSSNNSQGQGNGSSQEQDQENRRRTQQDSDGNNQGRKGQNDSDSQGNQGNSQGNKKSGKKRGGQYGEEGNDQNGQGNGQGEQNGNQEGQGGQGNQGKNGKGTSNKKPHRHQPLGPDGKPIQKGGQGGKGGQGPIDWNDLSDEEKKNIRDAIKGGDTGKNGEKSEGTPINNLPPDLQYGGNDTGAQFGDGGDQLTPEEGENILQKINGGQMDPIMDNPDEKWRDANLNQKAGKLPTDDDLSKLPPSVRKKAGNGWQEGHLATKQKIMDAMKSDVNWQDKLMGYIKGAFKAWREKVNKRDLGLNRDFIRKIERTGGESIGNIAFALDQSGSMWGQTGAKDNDGNAIPSSMRKFFKEIAEIRKKIGKPIKGIATWAFAADEDGFDADYFPHGIIPFDWNPIQKSGGTQFDNIFKLMKDGKVYDKKDGHRLWSGYKDAANFPIVTVICTDGEDDVPYRANVWDTREKLIIWFVINQSPTYIQSFKKRLENAGYSTKYYIGITTDQI
ncbi:MAG: hypothetical protein ACI4TD_12385 [Phocaeicola sp.]